MKVWEALHLAHAFGQAAGCDLVHNHYDFLPLTYASLVATPMVTTIHGFSGEGILPVYRAYNGRTRYVSISASDRHPDLDYVATVHHGIDLAAFTYRPQRGEYLLFFGRIHPDKGAADAIRVARASGLPLVLAGIVQDQAYFDREVLPNLGDAVHFVGSVGPEARDKWLGGALGLLHLIHFDEPFGLSVIEAMACGTPVVAYRRGSMAELIVDGTSGFLVADEAAAIEAVGRLAALDRSAVRRHAAASFSVDRMVAAYLAVYQTMLAADTIKSVSCGTPISPTSPPGHAERPAS